MLERRRLDLNASAEGIFQQEAQHQNCANHGDHCCNHEIAQPGALNLEQQAEPDRHNASQDDNKPHGRRYLRAAELQTPLPLPPGRIHLGQHVAEDFLLCWAAYAQTLNGGYQSVEIHLRRWAILPLGHRLPLQVVQYAKSVTTMEWQAMAQGEDSPAAQMDFDRLITAVQGLRVRGPAEQEVLGNMLAQVDAAARERQRRLELSGPQIPAPMWLAVILTSVVTIAFCLLFEIKSARLRYFMVAAVVAVISAILVLSLLLEYPFSGSIEVKPTPFQHVAGELR